MDSLLVLGLVPGTDIQITFLGWLMLGAAIVASFGLLLIKRRHIVMFLVLELQLKRQLAQLDVSQLPQVQA